MTMKMILRGVLMLMLVQYENSFAASAPQPSSTQPASTKERPITLFPANVDLSTPQSALAAFHRAVAHMDGRAVADLSWVKINPAEEEEFWKREKTEDPEGLAQYNRALLDAKMIGAWTYKGNLAGIVCRLSYPEGKGKNPYSLRVFGFINGQWKNLGEERFAEVNIARAQFHTQKEYLWTCFLTLRQFYTDQMPEKKKAVGGSEVQDYRLGKPATAFADQELSTPEGAYSAFNQATADMDVSKIAEFSWIKINPTQEAQAWKRRQRDDAQGLTTYNRALRNARILRVFVFREDLAGVISSLQFPSTQGDKPYELRWFGRINGNWKNLGLDPCQNLEEAKKIFFAKKERKWEEFVKISSRSLSEKAASRTKEKQDIRPSSIFLMESVEKKEPVPTKPAAHVKPDRKVKHVEPTESPTKEFTVETHIAADGKQVDRIDYPFVNDTAVIGKWISVDFIQNMEDFNPGVKSWQSSLFLRELHFKRNGTMVPPAFRWTKGLVLNKPDQTASKYIIKKIDGKTFLFFEWKSGDYIIRHTKPQYYVLKKE